MAGVYLLSPEDSGVAQAQISRRKIKEAFRMGSTYAVMFEKERGGLAGLASMAIDPYRVREQKRNAAVWETIVESGSVDAVSDAVDYFETQIMRNKPTEDEVAQDKWADSAWWNNNAGNLRWIGLIRDVMDKVRSGKTDTITLLQGRC